MLTLGLAIPVARGDPEFGVERKKTETNNKKRREERRGGDERRGERRGDEERREKKRRGGGGEKERRGEEKEERGGGEDEKEEENLCVCVLKLLRASLVLSPQPSLTVYTHPFIFRSYYPTFSCKHVLVHKRIRITCTQRKTYP